jgi:hypothetical protein
VQLTEISAKLKLKAGATKSVKVSAAIGAQVPEGDYTLVALISGSGVNPANVTASGPALRVEQPFVSLTPSVNAVPLPRPVIVAKPLAFSIPLRNDGNVDAKGTAAVELLLSTDGSATTATSLGTVSAKVGVKPGSTKPAKLKASLPANLAPGTYFLLARVTGQGVLGTLNRTNGQVLAAVQFTIM